MPFKIVRNDITKMDTEAIVNTANKNPVIGVGCDAAVYKAAGYEELLEYRRKEIGFIEEGEAFITPGFALPAKFIIHAVSPIYMGGECGEEKKLRSCYRKSLQIAKDYGIKSLSIPLISTGSFGYPKEEGMRIAVDEINAFLLTYDMDIFLVVFDEKAVQLVGKIYPNLEEYIDKNYVDEANIEEYENDIICSNEEIDASVFDLARRERSVFLSESQLEYSALVENDFDVCFPSEAAFLASNKCIADPACLNFDEEDENSINERIKHMTDTYSEYLMYLIKEHKMENAEVWKRAIVDRKIFSKIKNNPNYHPNKLTALCLCIGAKLNLDETKDLLARAGYALSPCDKTDIIFSYFIENEIYDMIELDIQLEEHGLPCIIS